MFMEFSEIYKHESLQLETKYLNFFPKIEKLFIFY